MSFHDPCVAVRLCVENIRAATPYTNLAEHLRDLCVAVPLIEAAALYDLQGKRLAINRPSTLSEAESSIHLLELLDHARSLYHLLHSTLPEMVGLNSKNGDIWLIEIDKYILVLLLHPGKAMNQRYLLSCFDDFLKSL